MNQPKQEGKCEHILKPMQTICENCGESITIPLEGGSKGNTEIGDTPTTEFSDTPTPSPDKLECECGYPESHAEDCPAYSSTPKPDFKAYLEEQLKDPEIKEEYDKVELPKEKPDWIERFNTEFTATELTENPELYLQVQDFILKVEAQAKKDYNQLVNANKGLARELEFCRSKVIESLRNPLSELTAVLYEEFCYTGLATEEQWNESIAPKLRDLVLAIEGLPKGTPTARVYKFPKGDLSELKEVK